MTTVSGELFLAVAVLGGASAICGWHALFLWLSWRARARRLAALVSEVYSELTETRARRGAEIAATRAKAIIDDAIDAENRRPPGRPSAA